MAAAIFMHLNLKRLVHGAASVLHEDIEETSSHKFNAFAAKLTIIKTRLMKVDLKPNKIQAQRKNLKRTTRNLIYLF